MTKKRRCQLVSWYHPVNPLVCAAVVGACITYGTPASAQSGGSYSVADIQNPVKVQPLPKVDITLKNATVEEALYAIAAKAKMAVSWSRAAVPLQGTVSLSLRDVDVRQALAQVLRGSGGEARLSANGQTIFVVRTDTTERTTPPQKTGSISGFVIDSATNHRIRGVSVTINGDIKRSEVTTEQGRFQLLDLPAGEYVVQFRLFGYKATSRVITVAAEKAVAINVMMMGTPTVLSGMVTTATGTQRKVEVGNDITRINVDSVMRLMPVSSVSDLLATRVPGMNVASTSGSPGAPSKIRIRGLSSINATNDPIVILDGIRMNAAQGSQGVGSQIIPGIVENTGGLDRSENMVEQQRLKYDQERPRYLVQSPLDQIDPNSIETIDVLKGPSAVALYGTDAANGVIIITTKRGQVGPPKWNVTATVGTQTMPGTWPTNYHMWGTTRSDVGTAPTAIRQCGIVLAGNRTCTQDSLVAYQLLNDSRTTVFGRGNTQTYRADIRGGGRGLTYALGGSASTVLGIMKMPDVDVARLRAGNMAVPKWQRRPESSEQQSANARIDIAVGSAVTTSLTNMLTRSESQTTPLLQSIGLASSFLPSATDAANLELLGSGLLQKIPDFRKKIATRSLRASNALDIRAVPKTWLNMNTTLGVDVTSRRDQSTIDRDPSVDINPVLSTASVGEYNTGQGFVMTTSLNTRVSTEYKMRQFVSLRTSIGGNYTRNTQNDLIRLARNLPVGATSGNGAAEMSTTERGDDRSTAGVYLETTIGIADRFFLPLAIRQDAGSALGSQVAPKFPKLSFSYVVSDQPGFQRIPVLRGVNTLRLRTAYGQSGVQPSVSAKLRTYTTGSNIVDGKILSTIGVRTVGNPQVRPERTSEFEGGVDVGVFDNRVNLTLTGYQKHTRDALVSLTLPPSLGDLFVFGTQMNIGLVTNNGAEMTLDVRALDRSAVSWTVGTNLSLNRNRLVRLGRSAFDAYAKASGSAQRFVEGYPLYGRWARPVIGFTDVDSDGFIAPGEVLLGDSSVYLGAPYPKYEGAVHSTLTLFSRLTVGASISYQNGQNQLNETLRNSTLTRAYNDPLTPLATQAYMVVVGKSDIGIAQTVSTLRFNALSINYILPGFLTRTVLPNRQLSVALQGQNLGLMTNYRGKDPNVNAALSDVLRDNGVLPTPRTWQLSFRIN